MGTQKLAMRSKHNSDEQAYLLPITNLAKSLSVTVYENRDLILLNEEIKFLMLVVCRFNHPLLCCGKTLEDKTFNTWTDRIIKKISAL